MKFGKYIALIVLAMSLLVSCDTTQNQDPPPQDTCVYYTQYFQDITTHINHRTFDYYSPCFNPNNSNEFIYVNRDPTNLSDIELHKYNLSTQIDVLLSPLSEYSYMFSWNSNGWIFFNNTVNDVWKIRDDGQNLQQLTFTTDYFFPVCQPNGNYLVVEHSAWPPHMVIMDQMGNLVDTLPNSTGKCVWLNDSLLLVAQSTKDFTVYSYSVNSIDSLFSGTLPINPTGMRYVQGTTIALNLGGIITFYDYSLDEITMTKSNCGDRYIYTSFSISPNADKIIAERLHYEAIHLDTMNSILSSQRDIVLMNIDGSNEQVITLPQ